MAMNYRITFSCDYVSIRHNTGEYLFHRDQYAELWDAITSNGPNGETIGYHVRLPQWTDYEWNQIMEAANEAVCNVAAELEVS